MLCLIVFYTQDVNSFSVLGSYFGSSWLNHYIGIFMTTPPPCLLSKIFTPINLYQGVVLRTAGKKSQPFYLFYWVNQGGNELNVCSNWEWKKTMHFPPFFLSFSFIKNRLMLRFSSRKNPTLGMNQMNQITFKPLLMQAFLAFQSQKYFCRNYFLVIQTIFSI